MCNKMNPSSIVKSSSGETYFFYLDTDSSVKYERFSNKKDLIDTNTLYKNKVLEFFSDIDRKDNVHVLCLTYEGKLIYFLYSNFKWSSSIISNLDIKSNKYSNLVIKVNNDNLHIMYAFSNLINTSAWTIQHIMCIKNKWDKTNVISITTGKSVPHFNFNFDKFNNIHMVYKLSSRGKESIYYISFNILLKKWSKVPQLISDLNSIINSYPYLFVDSKDNLHIVWCTTINNEYQLSYKHLSSSGHNSFSWKSENLPVQNGSIIYPIIYEEKNLIKIIVIINNTLRTILSTDNGFTWKLGYERDLKSSSKQKPMNYSSNFQVESSRSKIHDIYLNVEDSFIQLPNLMHGLDSLTEVKKNNFLNEDFEKKDIEKNLSSNEATALHESLTVFNNEIVRNFIISTKNNIDAIYSSDEKIEQMKSKLEKIILENSLFLDQSITDYSRNQEEILISLENLEILIDHYKNENKLMLELVHSAEEVIVSRESTILALEAKLNQLKEVITSYSNKSTLKKIISAFKKEV